MLSTRKVFAISDRALGWSIRIILFALAATSTRVAISVVRTAQAAVQTTRRNQPCFALACKGHGYRLITGRSSLAIAVA